MEPSILRQHSLPLAPDFQKTLIKPTDPNGQIKLRTKQKYEVLSAKNYDYHWSTKENSFLFLMFS